MRLGFKMDYIALVESEQQQELAMLPVSLVQETR